MKKIFQLAQDDWLKGNSVQSSLNVGGLFRTGENFNPFERMGTMSPAGAGTQVGSGTVDEAIRYFVPAYYGGSVKVLGYGDDSSLFEFSSTFSSVSDISAEIESGSDVARGAIMWRGKFVYLKNTKARSWNLDATDADILTSLTTGVPHDPCIGADGNLYIPNGNKVARCILETGTTDNSTNVYELDSDLIIRDLKNDGQFLVILADANTNNDAGIYRCVQIYWDMVSGNAERIYDWYENRAYGMIQKDEGIYTFGSDMLYLGNVASKPKPITPFNRTSLLRPPTTPNLLTYFRNNIVWARTGSSFTDNNAAASKIDGFGSLFSGQKPVFFNAINKRDSVSNVPTAFSPYIYDATQSYWLLAVTDADGANPKVFRFNFAGTDGGARSTATVRVVDIPLPQPHKLEYVKVFLKEGMITGQSVTLTLKANTGNTTPISAQQWSYGGVNNQVNLFYPVGDAEMENISELTLTSAGATIEKVEVWATPMDNQIAKF